MISIRSIHAHVTVVGAICKNLVLGLVLRRRGGAVWLARIRREALAPTPALAWQRFAGGSRCIGCGLCDGIEALDGNASTSEWILGSPRRQQDAPLAAADATRLRDHATAIAAICPAGLDLCAVADIIADNAAALADSPEPRR